MTTKFKIGDVVNLKSGGPDMTISDFKDYGVGVICQWFMSGELRRGVFNPDELSLKTN